MCEYIDDKGNTYQVICFLEEDDLYWHFAMQSPYPRHGTFPIIPIIIPKRMWKEVRNKKGGIGDELHHFAPPPFYLKLRNRPYPVLPHNPFHISYKTDPDRCPECKHTWELIRKVRNKEMKISDILDFQPDAVEHSDTCDCELCLR